MEPGMTLRPTTAEDWREFRELRLEMLEDAPLAFEERLSDARGRPESEWRARAARGSDPAVVGTTLAAITGAGVWAGTMRGFLGEPDRDPWLATVYVRPRFRGRSAGVADALLDAIEDWARSLGRTLTLEVNERNPRARAFYGARGFVETGGTRPYPFDPSLRELQMRKWL